jgi:hypothetical protein
VASGSLAATLVLVELASGESMSAAMKRLGRHPDVAYVEPNYVLHLDQIGPPETFPNDFDFGRQWSLRNTGQNEGLPGADIHAAAAWSVVAGAPGFVVAVIDTGTDYFHPDLEANLWVNAGETAGNGLDDDQNGYRDDVHGYDFVSRDSDPMEDHYHGTHVAGIIGAVGNNNVGMTGVAWRVSLMALKAFDEDGDSQVWTVVEAIQYAVANGARLINASWSQTNRSQALADAVAEALEAGVLFVASAGNLRTDRLPYPAAEPGVINVAATNNRDERASFSNYGPGVTLAAPGDLVFSVFPNNRYEYLSGTSMAAPHVSGTAALVWSRHPEFTLPEIQNILRNATDPPATDYFVGSGRLNAARAVTVDIPLPVAAWDLPAVVCGQIDLRGTAAGPRFTSYLIEAGKGTYPSNWVALGAGSQPVVQGVLLPAFSTVGLPDGEHVLRLTVQDQLGQLATALANVTVRNLNLASPAHNDIRRAGDLIPIQGTVFGPGRTYRVEYGVGWAPSSWSTNGVQLVNDGQENVVNGTLAWWDTRAAATNEFYQIRLLGYAGEALVGRSYAQLVYLDGLLHAGWPQYLPTEGDYPSNDWRHVTVADLDGNGRQEIIRVDPGTQTGKPATLMVFAPEGVLRWSRVLAAGNPYSDVPVVGDVDGDGFPEIFVDVGDPGILFAFRHDGSPLPGNWPVKLEVPCLGKVLADLNGDGHSELIGYAQGPSGLDPTVARQLVVFDTAGNLLRKWSLEDIDTDFGLPRMFPAVCPFSDAPGLGIVAVAGEHSLALFDLNRPAGPVWKTRTKGSLLGSPVVGNVSGNSEPEIIIGAYEYWYEGRTATSAGIHAFDLNGVALPGWPVLVEHSFPLAPALADLDGDSQLEIVVVSYYQPTIHVLTGDGFELPGWPIGPLTGTAFKTSPVIGDVNGDGAPDVVAIAFGQVARRGASGDLAQFGGVRAWNSDGTPIPLNPRPDLATMLLESSGGNRLKAASPVLTDVDHDGKLDLVAASIDDYAFPTNYLQRFSKHRYTISVLTLNGAPYVSTNLPWPTFQHDAQHRGYLERVPPTNQPPALLPLPDQTIRTGTTFFPLPLEQYVSDPDDAPGELSWTISGGGELRVGLSSNRVASVAPPTTSWAGRQTLTFEVRDPGGLSATATATYEARPDYEPPVAAPDLATMLADQTLDLDVVANDTHPHGLPLRVLNFSRPAHGRVQQNADGTLRYTPHQYFFGADAFTYTVGDGAGGLAMAAVSVTVQRIEHPPVAELDQVITEEDTAREIDVLANDYDPDGDRLVLLDFTQPAHGSVSALPQGRLWYVPAPGFNGSDGFTYRIADEYQQTSSTNVAIQVKPTYHPPVATPLSYVLNRNTKQNVTYAGTGGNGPLTFSVVQAPAHGQLLTYPTVATYYPTNGFSGTDSFTYTASDGQGTSEPALVTLTVLAVNNPPVAANLALTNKVGRPLALQLQATDADLEEFTFRVLDAPQHGTLAGSESNWVYTPEPGFLGADQFHYLANDGQADGPPASVTITLTDRNTSPLATSSAAQVILDHATNLVLQATDGESDPLTYTLLTLPAHGQLSESPSLPNLRFTPEPHYLGPDRLTFQANDGQFDSAPATVTIAVVPPNHPPVVADESLVLPADRTSLVPLNVTDLDGDPLRTAILKGPKHGFLAGLGTNYSYVPVPGFVGTDTFTYKVWDGTIYSSVGTVTLTIQARPPPTPPAFVSLQVLANGSVRLMLTAMPSRTVQIQSSTDLTEWTARASLVAATNQLTWIDTNAADSSARFYRARSE